MTIGEKLQLRPGQSVRSVDAPAHLESILQEGRRGAVSNVPDALIVFVRDIAGLRARADEILGWAAADRLTWVAYPKAGALGTDLTRDVIRAFVRDRGVDPVRQVALDETWSALRLRPARPA